MTDARTGTKWQAERIAELEDELKCVARDTQAANSAFVWDRVGLQERIAELEAKLAERDKELAAAEDRAGSLLDDRCSLEDEAQILRNELAAAEAVIAEASRWFDREVRTYQGDVPYHYLGLGKILSTRPEVLAVVDGYIPKDMNSFPWVHHEDDEYDELPEHLNVETAGGFVNGDIKVRAILVAKKEGE